MFFLAPLMLLGTLAAAVPIAIHFFYRSRYRTVPWAAMKFLLTSLEQTSRRLKFQELLLLLARIALLVLLALALARPTSWQSLAGASARGDAVDAIFLIDNSYSMAVREPDGTTRLDKAKTAAKAILDQLPPLSTVLVVACSDRAAELPEKGLRTPGDFNQVRKILDQVEVAHHATDYRPGFELAAKLIETGSNPNKAVYLFSDMQASAWQRQEADLAATVQALSKSAGIYLVRSGRHSPTNVAVVNITPPLGILHTGELVPFSVQLRNTGKTPARGLNLRLDVDGKPAEGGGAAVMNREGEQILEPGATREVSVKVRFTKPGTNVVTAVLTGDDLDVDNRLDRVVQVHETVRVLIVDGRPNPDHPEESASYYLGHGLVLPTSEKEKRDYYIQLRVIPAAQAHPKDLMGADVCFLADVPLRDGVGGDPTGLLPEFVTLLARRVAEGNPLVVFTGERVSAPAYNRILYEQHKLLPAKLGEPVAAPDERTLFYFDPDTALAPLERFKEGALKLLAAVGVQKLQTVQEPQEEGCRVALRFAPLQENAVGRPAVLTRKVGDGTVMFVATSPDAAWTNWPKAGGGLYVAFVLETLKGLLPGRTEGLNRVVGEPLTFHPALGDVGKPVTLVNAQGETVRLGPVQEVQGRPTATLPETHRIGIYRLVVGTSLLDDKAPQATFAVALEPLPEDPTRLRESDNLDGLEDPAIDGVLGVTVRHLDASTDPGGFVTAERFNRDWTFWFLAGVLGLALIEAALAWFCGRPVK